MKFINNSKKEITYLKIRLLSIYFFLFSYRNEIF